MHRLSSSGTCKELWKFRNTRENEDRKFKKSDQSKVFELGKDIKLVIISKICDNSCAYVTKQKRKQIKYIIISQKNFLLNNVHICNVKLKIQMNTKNTNKSEIIKQNKHKVVKY